MPRKHCQLPRNCKENYVIMLVEKLLSGYHTESEAPWYAERILRTNAVELYKLEVTKQ